jgi:hypothetical protein
MRAQIKDLQEVAVLLQASSARNSASNALLLQVFTLQVKLSENAITTMHNSITAGDGPDTESSEEVLLKVRALLKSM